MTTRIPTRPTILVLSIFLLLAAPALAAGEAAEGELTLETERVVIFKDGHGLFVKTATGKADAEGSVFTHEVPDAAVLGTFWAIPDRGVDDMTMRAEWVESIETRVRVETCVTLRDLLRANVGRDVTLGLRDEMRRTGRILDVLERSPDGDDGYEDDTRPVLRPTSLGPVVHSVAPVVPLGGDLVVLKLAEGTEVALPIASIESVEGAELERRCKRKEKITDRRKRLAFDLGEEAAGREVSLRVLYFTPGIRWIPTYRLMGDLEEKGVLELQGEILNEVEDIEGAALDLVVGVPNFRFREVVSPFALEGTLRQALQVAAPGLSSQMMSNTFAQRSGEWRGAAEAAPADVMGVAPELAASAYQDLFVYRTDDLSLGKGARAAVRLWRDELALRHLYTLDVNLVRDARSGSTSARAPGLPDTGESSPLELARHRVWHQLELKNESDVPWTTGAVMLLQELIPLGQELLAYTPRGAESLLPVTVAVDVRARHGEEEVARQPDALRWDGSSYALIRKEGEITVTNFRSEAISIRVAAHFGGRAEAASDGATIRLDDFRSADWASVRHPLNNHSEITWNVELAPGEEKTLSYTCSFYVR